MKTPVDRWRWKPGSGPGNRPRCCPSAGWWLQRRPRGAGEPPRSAVPGLSRVSVAKNSTQVQHKWDYYKTNLVLQHCY